MRKASETIKRYALLPLHILQKDKRRSGIVDVYAVIDNLLEVFNPFLEEADINIAFEKLDKNVFILGSESLIEVIITSQWRKKNQDVNNRICIKNSHKAKNAVVH